MLVVLRTAVVVGKEWEGDGTRPLRDVDVV